MNGPTTPLPLASSAPTSVRTKRWIFRAIAGFGVPAAVLLLIEGSLRVFGFGQAPHFLIPDTKPGYYRTNPDYLALYMPRSFDLRPLNFRVARTKPPNTLRIVILGESAAQGVPEPAFGFAPQLRALLRGRYPGRNIEVINAGIVAINSHVVYQVARDLAQFSPDVFVIYMGNNEVVGPYGPGCAYLSAMPPLCVIRASIFVRSTRIGQLVTLAMDFVAAHFRRPADWGGMSMFVHNGVAGDDPRLETVYHNFDVNLRAIVETATRCDAKTLLCTVVSNLKDCAPMLSRHRPDMTSADLTEWQEVFERGRLEWLLGENVAAAVDLRRALHVDPQYADTAFLLGTVELQSGDVIAGRRHLVAAEHWDALRFRPDPRVNEVIRRVAVDNPGSVKLIDAARELGSDPGSTGVPAGRELLFEHVHFDWRGNYELACALAAGVAQWDGAPPPTAWLNSDGCAASLACTPYARSSVLMRNWDVVHAPPFTNQITYPQDQAKLERELQLAQAISAAPATRRHAKIIVSAALDADPENPALWKAAEEIDDDLGDTVAALDDIQAAERFQPQSFALETDEAIKLARLGRYTDAEQRLNETWRTCSLRDRALMAPAFVDLYTRTNRLAEAGSLLDPLVARLPRDPKLHLLRAQVARGLQDNATAEREYRHVLRDDPSNQAALETLIEVLRQTGRTADAERESLAAAEHQPTNHANNLRAALLADARGDGPGALRWLTAAEHSGPITSAVELRLGRKLLDDGRMPEALLHLALARRLASFEGNADTVKQLDEVIAELRSRPQR